MPDTASSPSSPSSSSSSDRALPSHLLMEYLPRVLTAILTIAAVIWALKSDIRDLKTTEQLHYDTQQQFNAEVRAEMKENAKERQRLAEALARAGLLRNDITVTNHPDD